MTKTTHSYRNAGFAIAATLALGSTPALAQMTSYPAAPAPQPAPVMAPAAPAPTTTVVNPPVIFVPNEVAQPLPTPSAATPPVNATIAPATTTARVPAARTPTTTTRATPRPVAVAAPVVAPAAAAPAASTEALQAPVEAVPMAAPVASESAPMPDSVDTQPANDTPLGMIALIVGAMAVIGLAIWGFIAMGRRRRPAQRNALPVIERPIVPEAKPVALVAEPMVAEHPVAEVSQLVTTPAPSSLSHSGASVALPRSMPQTFEERDALLKRMVAAKPDRANPFHGYKARVYRARLILQSLGRDFGDTMPWIDLSQYSSNWPELARNRYAA